MKRVKKPKITHDQAMTYAFWGLFVEVIPVFGISVALLTPLMPEFIAVLLSAFVVWGYQIFIGWLLMWLSQEDREESYRRWEAAQYERAKSSGEFQDSE